jgi:membrane-bound metal-dependent hydrolase YbcI (DUF457 family)
MDNVTHTLFALTLARTPLGRGRGTTVALVLASNAPDADVVTALNGAAEYLRWHRGPTHGPLGVIGLGLVAAGLVWGGRRLIMRAWGPPSGGRIRLKPDPTHDAMDATFPMLVMASIVGVLAHILMDLPTSYGTRLLSPFSWRWFAMDLMPIIDVYLWIILAAGLVIGARWPTMRSKMAVAALLLMAANYGVRAASHEQALSVASRRYGPTLPAPCEPAAAFGSLLDSWPSSIGTRPAARCILDTAAIPSFASPFEWRVIAQLPDGYLEVNGGDATWIPNQWTPLVERAATTRTAQVLLGFSRFPFAGLFVESPGTTTVRFTDLRFTMGPDNPQLRARRSALFTATVRFGPHDEILGEMLGQ